MIEIIALLLGVAFNDTCNLSLSELQAKAAGTGDKVVELTHEQEVFARGLFASSILVQDIQPPGDKVEIVILHEPAGTPPVAAFLAFVDGDRACDFLPLTQGQFDALKEPMAVRHIGEGA